MPQYDFNLRDYFRIFRKRKLVIILTFLLVCAVSYAFLSTQPTVYQADCTVKIEERKTIAGLLTEWIMYNPGDVMESQTKIIRGFPIMRQVALRLKLIDQNSSEDQINEAVNRLQDQVETERIESTNMIKIKTSSASPDEAMNLANTVAEVYIEENLTEKAKQARHVRQFIQDQLSGLDSRLKESEEKLKEFGTGTDVKFAAPIEQKLIELEFQRAELLQKYTEKHPLVIQIREQIKELQQRVSDYSGQELEYARLTREIDVNKKLYAILKEKLEEARITEAQKVGDISIVNPAFLPTTPLSGNKQLKFLIGAFLGLLLGLTFAFVTETLDTSIATIEDVESVIKLPVLGVVPSFESAAQEDRSMLDEIKELFRGKKRTPSEEAAIRLIAHYKPQSPITEAYRNIHTNLKLDQSKKTILITSSNPQEGKSSVVCNLAIVMSQLGLKTLIISSDLRRPVLSKTFGIPREPGLSELAMGTATLDQALYSITDILLGTLKIEDIQKTRGIDNIWIIPSGSMVTNPVEIIESAKLQEIVEAAKKRFDFIIFDSPPVLPVTDASLLAPKMDCVIIVYEIGRTSREALLRTKIQLETVGARITGIVLNHTKPQTEALATYPYNYRYKYRYYDEEHQKKQGGFFKKARKRS